MPILPTYADRLPGAFLEEKQYSVVWHYRRADPGLAAARARERVDDLVNFTAHIDVHVQQGSRVVEVHCGGVDKGTAVPSFLPEDASSEVLAIGADWTDEDLLRVLPGSAFSIRVGHQHSWARFHLRCHEEVLDLRQEIRAAQAQECGLRNSDEQVPL